VHLDGIKGSTLAMEDHVTQNAGIVHDAVELAVGVDRLLDDLAGRNGSATVSKLATAVPPAFRTPHNLFRRCALPEPSGAPPDR
jgi:hypothetical protein